MEILRQKNEKKVKNKRDIKEGITEQVIKF